MEGDINLPNDLLNLLEEGKFPIANEEVQKTFLKLSPISETVEVVNIILRRIAQKMEICSQGAFQALLRNPKQVEPEDSPFVQHFAKMTAKVLQESGGDYAQFAQELAQSWVIPKIKLKSFPSETVKVDRKGKIIERETHSARYYSEDLGYGISLDMVYIPGGEFWMGSDDKGIERLIENYGEEWFRFSGEKPRHKVTVPSFYRVKYTITQAQWKVIAELTEIESVSEPEPSNFKGEKRPVERVNWYEVVEYCQRLSKKTGKEYRLPSEAEWEYACRAVRSPLTPLIKEAAEGGGSKGLMVRSYPFYFGETITTVLANYDGRYTYTEESKGKYRKRMTEIGQFPSKAFGLYDLHGNVWEWCLDDWHENYESAPVDGREYIDDNHYQYKCLRGGSWRNLPRNCRSASRNGDSPASDSKLFLIQLFMIFLK